MDIQKTLLTQKLRSDQIEEEERKLKGSLMHCNNIFTNTVHINIKRMADACSARAFLTWV